MTLQQAEALVKKAHVQDSKFDYAFESWPEADYRQYLQAMRVLKKHGQAYMTYYKAYLIEEAEDGYKVIDQGKELASFETYDEAKEFIDNRDDVSEFGDF